MGANPSRACCCSFTRGWGSCFSEKCRMRGVRAGIGVLGILWATLGLTNYGRSLNIRAELSGPYIKSK